MIYFLDASALVKRYIDEPGSDAIRDLVRKKRRIAASSLSGLEVPAALFRHPLRVYDAAQLACAVRLARSTGLAVTFGCTDTVLRAAAKAEGLRLMPLPSR